jgi:hypothetical protein
MSHAYLCQRCASKRALIVTRTSGYVHKRTRCDGCRRLTRTATCCSVTPAACAECLLSIYCPSLGGSNRV